MPAGKISITIADENDASVITALSVTTFCEAYMEFNKKEHMDSYIAEAMTLEKLTEELQDSRNLFLIARYDDLPIGYAKMRTIKKPVELANNNPAEIERIYVLKEYHNKKAGAALMSTCIATAENKQHDILWLGVWEHNHRAIRFYKQWGFDLFGSHIFPFGDEDQIDVMMKKELGNTPSNE